MKTRCIITWLFTLIWMVSTMGAVIAQDILEDEEPADEVEIPLVIYGNEPELSNNILLTIDDCFSEEKTREMFEFLRERDLTATFFPVSSIIAEHDPALWQEVVAAGFEIGYHTRYHQDNLTIPQLEADFAAFTEDIRTILDDPEYTIHYVRPPWGIWNRDWLTWAEANDLHTVRWNLVTRFDLNMDYFEGVLKHPDGGAIVLVHPRPTDMWWLEENIDAVLDLVDADGEPYHIVTITEAFND